MDLATLWFVVVAWFWLGYLFLEGFDLGVGMLLPVLGRDEEERRALLAGEIVDGDTVVVDAKGGSIVVNAQQEAAV